MFLVSCKNEVNTTTNKFTLEKPIDTLQLKYAEGFAVLYYSTYKELIIKKPWPKANESMSFKFSNDTAKCKECIKTPIQKIVVTSTTHIPALELLEETKALVGFPGMNYISSPKVRHRISEGKVRELGKNEGINTEVLLDMQPDVVMGFGVSGRNAAFEVLDKVNIPVLYNGDWVEGSALAKAEWIKCFGVLFNKEHLADSIFNTIETNYKEASELVKHVKTKPTVLSGALHKDVWYLPAGSSPEAQFLKDANVNYLWEESKGNGSLSLSLETVLSKAKNADLWLNPSYYLSLKDLESANTIYTKFNAFEAKSVYSFSNTKGETGGVLYYELGTARPDLVLKDIIKICHPNILPNYEPYFFKPLK